MYRLLNVHPICTTPYHPQTDGLVERFNKTLKSLLRRLIREDGRDWDKFIPYVLFTYREVPQTTTGFSPFELLFGREVRGHLDVLKEEWEAREKTIESVVSHIIGMQERMQVMSELVKENTEKQQAKQKRWYDRTTRERELSPEDKVLVLLPTSSNKLLAQWRGPYKIVQRIGKVYYEVQISKRKIFHINLLREWQEDRGC
uniref:Integrase catalytic domain-containing protein n=1 Tax=Amphimedon queenslandica TaxID=400682 RepID=A0A1X7U6I7_AMPQE